MVAGALHGIGIPMGDDLPVNIEDPEFNADQKNLEDFISKMKATIKLRDKKLDVWGWKYPRAVIYLDQIHPFIRNPHYVVVYRDPVPGAIRSTQGSKANKLPKFKIEAIKARLQSELANTKRIQALGVPTLLVSYEKAVAHPEVFLGELSEFTKVPLPSDLSALLDFLAPGQYKHPVILK